MPYNEVVKTMLIGIAATLALAGFAQAPERKATWFVFLVKGANPPKATEAEVTDYQKAHIENFKRLFGESKLLTAGPLQDPTESKRGIVVFSVKSRTEVTEGFSPDPYVQKGFMVPELYSVKPMFGKFNTTGIDPDGIVENRIAVFERASETPLSDEAARARLSYVKKEGPKAELAFYGILTGSKPILAVALFRGKDDAAIKKWLDNEPLVKIGALKYTLMPQWLSKGVL